jgi:soluble lytic murein transglycosylase-like protein
MPKATPTERRERDDSAHPNRRRAADRLPEPERKSPLSTAKSMFQRFRQPIIGLSLAGVAFPLVNASQSSGGGQAQPLQPQPVPQPVPVQPAPLQAVAQHAQEVEENVAEQIAVSKEDQERETAVTRAMTKHGISRGLAEDIYDIAREEGISPKLAYGLVKTESTFRERAQSHVGARGLTQVMPRTARWLMPGTKTEDLYNRQTNLRLGFRYLDKMIDKYDGNTRLALLAYNRGPGTVDKVLKRGGNPDNGYATKVLRGG